MTAETPRDRNALSDALTDLDGGLRDAALEYVESWDAYHVADNQYTESRLKAVYRTRDLLADALAGDMIEYPPVRALLATPAPPPDAAPRFREDDERRWATPGLPDLAVDIWRAAILRRRDAE